MSKRKISNDEFGEADSEELRRYFPVTTTSTLVGSDGVEGGDDSGSWKASVQTPTLDWKLIRNYDNIRFCPRCIDWINDFKDREDFVFRYPVELEFREQFCFHCKFYNWQHYRALPAHVFSGPVRMHIVQ